MKFELFKIGLKSLLEFLIAIVVLGFCFVFVYVTEISRIDDKVYTMAVVVDTKIEYDFSSSEEEHDQIIKFEYEVNGNKYTDELKKDLFWNQEGDSVEIYYLKSNPNITGTRFENLISIIIMSVLGLFFLSLSIGDFKKLRRQKEVTIGVSKYGKELIVQYDSIIPAYIGASNSSINQNDFRIVCKYVDPNTFVERRFNSEIISYPSDIIISVIENYNIKQFVVKCDSSNMSIYVMDISELKNKLKEVSKK